MFNKDNNIKDNDQRKYNQNINNLQKELNRLQAEND